MIPCWLTKDSATLDVLSFPAGEVLSERISSTASRVIKFDRLCLGPEQVSTVIIIKKHKRALSSSNRAGMVHPGSELE